MKAGGWWHADDESWPYRLRPLPAGLRAASPATAASASCGRTATARWCSRPTAGAPGFCIDPIEKKPLNHFYPGTSVLSFGTAGCNLGCKFCQNWAISKSREIERLSEEATPEADRRGGAVGWVARAWPSPTTTR